MRFPWANPSGRPRWAVDPAGAKVLAAAPSSTPSAWLLGTRTHLVEVAEPEPGPGEFESPDQPRVWRWEQVQAADWDQDTSRLTVCEVGEFGRPREEVSYVLDDAGGLLQLIRERITASVVLQRHVPVVGKRGFRVIARRSPTGGPLRWMHEYDEGVDPADPVVVRLAAEALDQARTEAGDSI